MTEKPHEKAEPIPAGSMTRGDQTIYIIFTLVVLTGFLAWALWPAPNLEGVSLMDRCNYSSWYSTHGGTQAICKAQTGEMLIRQLRMAF